MGESSLSIGEKLSVQGLVHSEKDSVHIKTKSFSFWSIFLCGGGGPKRKRATVFASKPNEEFDTICFRFYIYSDNEDSKKVIIYPCNI